MTRSLARISRESLPAGIRGAERLFGYTAEEAIGKQMAMLIPADRSSEEPIILARIARGEMTDHFETVRVRKDGSELDVSVSISPIRDRQGHVVGASKIARDITERKLGDAKVQAQLARLNLLIRLPARLVSVRTFASIFQVAYYARRASCPSTRCLYACMSPSYCAPRCGRGRRSAQSSIAAGLTERSANCHRSEWIVALHKGRLVYESDLVAVQFPFAPTDGRDWPERRW